jgi:RNA polymerase sigma factor (TIGR02999 family)
MLNSAPPTITELLVAWNGGDEAALAEVTEQVYPELRRIALGYLRHERPDHTLEASALVHEAYLRLVEEQPQAWHNRLHFFAAAARLMRRILVDHARRGAYAKRGGGAPRLSLDEMKVAAAERPPELLALDEALTELAGFDDELARIVELRYFGGLTAEEIGGLLGISVPTVTRRWRIARSWLHHHLAGEDDRRS